MIFFAKFLGEKKVLRFTVDSLLTVNKQNSVLLSRFYSNKFCFVKYKTILSLCSSNFKRQYMDLASVIKIFEAKVPPELAESWDNTGLLIEPSNSTAISTIFFTNDLTEAVLIEALTANSNLIISYHPPIFAPIKALRKSNWKDRIAIKCLENSIAVYSPHTACDAVMDGVNDWLIRCFDLSYCHPIHTSYESKPEYSHVLEFAVPSAEEVGELIKTVPHSDICDKSCDSDFEKFKVKVTKTSLNLIVQLLADIKGSPSISITALNPLPIPSCGMGRIGCLVDGLKLGDCIKLVKNYLNLDYIRFSQSASHSLDSTISTVAVCAGSGSSVLKGVTADLYITGEMSHHDLLDANHRNVSILLCEHSNSERGYLKHLADSLRPKLMGIKLIISSFDRDPITIV